MTNTYVRFAPSPTGLLHIGNIRAALFNYLFAKKTGGQYMLRLDDTDQERSKKEYADAIEADLKWLGISWDSFAKQSDRTARYEEELEKLKASGRVYPCFETPEELALKRKIQLGRGLPPVYDREALKMDESAIEKLIADGKKPHWRFKLIHEDVEWDDMVQGHKALPASSISDPVLVREDGVPLYTFCSIVDDIDFGITHTIRGEDHVTNTAVQLQIWRALTDKPDMIFGHFPLLVSADGKEMSKRLGTLSISMIRENESVEAMAINTLLARLGTSDPIAPCTDMQTLIDNFDMNKISRATPKFDLEELKKLSAKILHQTPFEKVSTRLDELGHGHITQEFWNTVRPNIEKLEDIDMWWKVTHGPLTPVIEDADFLGEAAALLPEGEWDETTWATWTNAVKEKTGRKGKQLFMPLRQALTGVDHGPELKVLLPLIGRENALARLSGKES